MTTYAVIMAGGSGTRFWPLSRKARPKQLLPLGPGPDSLLAETVRRIAPLIPADHVLIATSDALADAVAAAVPNVPRENILGEPTGRNTAPCVGWAAAHVARRDPSAVVVVLPSDHHIGDEPAFLSVLSRAIDAASNGDLVTVGIEPTRPETGYGYLEKGENLLPGVHRCIRFVEKPNRARADEFLASGRFLWNSGMFFFRADAILGAIRATLPELADALDRYDEAAKSGEEGALVRATYGALPNVSIDNGVMEKAGNIAVVPGSFGWSDLGSFQTAWELAAKDEAGNAVPAGTIVVDATGNFARSATGKLIALVGVEGLVVVETDDSILVIPRGRDQDVKRVVEELSRRSDTRL